MKNLILLFAISYNAFSFDVHIEEFLLERKSETEKTILEYKAMIKERPSNKFLPRRLKREENYLNRINQALDKFEREKKLQKLRNKRI